MEVTILRKKIMSSETFFYSGVQRRVYLQCLFPNYSDSDAYETAMSVIELIIAELSETAYFTTSCKIQFTTDKRMAKAIAHQKPSTSKPLTMLEAKRIISALITKVKSPSVSMLIGKVSKIKTGFMSAFKIPRIAAVKNADQKLLTWTPGKR